MKFFEFPGILPVLTVAILFYCCSDPNERHIGEWKGIDHGKPASLLLDQSNHAVLIRENQVIGGEHFQIKGKKVECRYEIDYTQKPIWLDLVVVATLNGKSYSRRIPGIVRFITDTKMEYRFSLSGERSKNFENGNTSNCLVLDKVTH